MRRRGTGTPRAQPRTNTPFRPNRSARVPARRLKRALARPKERMKPPRATPLSRSKASLAKRGTTVLSRPTIPPTRRLTRARSQKSLIR